MYAPPACCSGPIIAMGETTSRPSSEASFGDDMALIQLPDIDIRDGFNNFRRLGDSFEDELAQYPVCIVFVVRADAASKTQQGRPLELAKSKPVSCELCQVFPLSRSATGAFTP